MFVGPLKPVIIARFNRYGNDFHSELLMLKAMMETEWLTYPPNVDAAGLWKYVHPEMSWRRGTLGGMRRVVSGGCADG